MVKKNNNQDIGNKTKELIGGTSMFHTAVVTSIYLPWPNSSPAYLQPLAWHCLMVELRKDKTTTYNARYRKKGICKTYSSMLQGSMK
jgi:hypothetical protein